ncbi:MULTISPECIES: DUF4150 domain-containing protein [unclassified Serratia (in: enterobacteria)]|uniref:DUF4150 domain-containing protein n=1 Tax=unclassified Serratia (in: enterobacteria) TaxID=2647522 RepID=UPI00050561E3|nr:MULTISPECIES: DUF4150 domain-containing protein [unclassified Serratia (in: enterobacteria)]KFK97916.1 type VI secretion protein [Serratia sp. Ag2]KFL00307.1 type VI secretion protein [Serratia sp. Ag1]
MFANCQLMGLDLAFPDVCLTPTPTPTPIPYPDVAMGPTAIPNAYNLLLMGMPAHNMATVTPLTNGDNVGIATGVASGTVMGPSRHVTAAFTVLFKGTPATRLTSVSLQNSTNMVGMRTVPSQLKVLLLAP